MNSTTFPLDGTATLTMMTIMTAMKTMIKNSQTMMQGFSFMRHLTLSNCCLNAFLREGLIIGPGLEESVFVRSWHIHHIHEPRCWHHRTLELQGHWRHWFNDILDWMEGQK